jgi:predicted P-loop ATPase/GTPase
MCPYFKPFQGRLYPKASSMNLDLSSCNAIPLVSQTSPWEIKTEEIFSVLNISEIYTIEHDSERP